LLARAEGVLVYVENIVAILERVAGLTGPPGQLALLADRDEAGVEADGHGGSEHEAPGLHGGEKVYIAVVPGRGHLLAGPSQGFRVLEQGRDVAEEDARDGKVGHVADVAGEIHSSAALKYSRVLLRPSSIGVCGCQPRMVRARVVSGRRCLGSSC